MAQILTLNSQQAKISTLQNESASPVANGQTTIDDELTSNKTKVAFPLIKTVRKRNKAIWRSSQPSLVLFASAVPAMPTTSNSPSRDLSDARSAMSSLCHCAATIMRSYIATETRRRGGQTFKLHQLRWRRNFGWQLCFSKTETAGMRRSHQRRGRRRQRVDRSLLHRAWIALRSTRCRPGDRRGRPMSPPVLFGGHQLWSKKIPLPIDVYRKGDLP